MPFTIIRADITTLSVDSIVNAAESLYSCYRSSLDLAKENKLTSISLPLISPKTYGYTKHEAFRIAQTAIKDFLADNDMDITLVLHDTSISTISEQLFDCIKAYISDKLSAPDACIYSDMCYSATYSSAAPTANIKELFDDDHETFSEMLFRLIDEKGYTDVEVYKRANIDRKLFSKMRKKDYQPKKSTVMALIIALRLNMSEAKDLLCEAGFAFSRSSRFDIIIQYFIENQNYDIFQINDTLFAFNQPLLGA